MTHPPHAASPTLLIPAVRYPGGAPAFPPVSLLEVGRAVGTQVRPKDLEVTRFRSGGSGLRGGPADAPWRLVVPEQASTGPGTEALLEALEPLTAHRDALPPLRFRLDPALDPVDAVARWAEDHELEIEETTYFLVAGDPVDLPFALARHLARGKPAGRLSLETVDQYRAYADKVVAAERSPTRSSPLPTRPMLVFAPDGDEATGNSRRWLVDPYLTHLRQPRGASPKDLRGERPPLEIRAILGPAATRQALIDGLSGGSTPPSLLFSASHGLEQADPHDPDQGALCDQHFNPLRVVDLEALSGPVLPAGVAVLWACNGGGTPQQRLWTKMRPAWKAAWPKHDRAARLPGAMLSRAAGPLAVVAHEDVLLPESLSSVNGEEPKGIESPGVRPLIRLIEALLDGVPVGVAMQRMRRKLSESQHRLIGTLRDYQRMRGRVTPEDDVRLARDWLRWLDLQGWVVLGDPRVCLEAVPGQIRLEDVYRGDD